MADRVVRYVFKGDIKGLQASMSAASASVSKFAKDATAADKEGAKFRQGLSTLGDTAGKVGLVAAAGLGAAVLASANFDQAMSNVQAATHETAANMELLRDAARQAGRDTVFNANEAAAGIENLAKAGISTSSILNGGLNGALDLAAAGEMSVADAAEAAAGAMAQFKLDGSQVPHVADLLAAAAGRAQGDVSDMVMALKQTGTVAAQTGLSVEETAAALGAMAEQSLLGSDAGTSFKTMLAALTPNSDKAAKAMETYNIHAYDAQGNFVGLTELAGQLRDGLGNLTNEQRAMTLETIFGSDAVRAASIIYDNGADGIEKWTQNVNDAGYAAETASIRLDNLKGDVEQLGGSLSDLFIGQGEGSQSSLRTLTQSATEAVNAVGKLPAPLKDTATGMLAITAILGGGAWFSSKAIAGVASMRTMMVQLGLASETTALTMGTVASAAGVFAGITFTGIGTLDMMNSAKRSREAAEATATSFSELQGVLRDSNVGKYAADLGIDLDRLATDLATYGADGEYVAEVHQKLQDSGHGVGPMFKSLTGTIIPGYTNATEKASDALSDFNNILENNKRVAEASGDAGHAILSPFRVLDGVLQSVNDASGNAATGIGGLGRAIQTTTAEAQTLDNAMKSLFGALDADAALDAWRESIQGLTKELKGGEHALDGMTKKGRANKEEIRSSINALRERAQTQYEENGNLKQLERNLLRGRDAIIKQAKAANIGDKAIRDYLKHLRLTPEEIKTEINLMRAPEAQAKLKEIQDAADELNRTRPLVHVDADASEALRKIAAVNYARIEDKSFTITTYYDAVTRDSAMATARPPVQRASGGPVYGPGSATSDSIPAYLSNGEYVVKAAAVAKYGQHFFDQVNAMRFADGGSVYRAQRASTTYATTNNYGHSGPMQISGRLRMDDGRMADITGVVDDRIAANARQDRATGRRR